jgi:hypothetical protein
LTVELEHQTKFGRKFAAAIFVHGGGTSGGCRNKSGSL